MLPDRHVLIVEDEARFRALLETSLSRRGWICTGTDDPGAAIRAMETGSVSHALLDLHLGTHSGLDLLRVISDRWPGVRIVAMSGAVVGTGRAALLAGAAMFLPKPVSPLKIVADALEGTDRHEDEPAGSPH